MNKYIILDIIHMDGYERCFRIKEIDGDKVYIIHFLEYDEYVKTEEKTKKRKEGDIITGKLYIDYVIESKKVISNMNYRQNINRSPQIEAIVKIAGLIDDSSVYANSLILDEKILIEFENKINYSIGDMVYVKGSLEMDIEE